MTASVSSDNQIFIGIDVGGVSFEAAWHRGGCAQYENRPDAIAAFVARLGIEKQIIRIAIEPTGGYEKPLVKALRGAGLPVEMVHAETCRLATVQSKDIREEIAAHLEALREAERKIHAVMKHLVHQRDDLSHSKRLLQTIKGIGDKTALTSIAGVPELGLISTKAGAALIGVAPFVRQSGTMNAPARIHGGRAPVRTSSTWPRSLPA